MNQDLIKYQLLQLLIHDIPHEQILEYLKIDQTEFDQLQEELAPQVEKGKEIFQRVSGVGQEFMQKTTPLYNVMSDQQRGMPQPPLQNPYDPSLKLIDLPSPDTISVKSIDLRNAIEKRQSIRQYTPTSLTLAELSYLLWCTQGVREKGPSYLLRNVPSAGARHAFETYLLINRVENLTPGLYRYLSIEHQLLELNTQPQITKQIVDGCGGQQIVATCAVTFIWTAIPYRMGWRYGERGYRYLHLDAGHVCQNLYLTAETMDCGVCAIAAYLDEYLNDVLQIDGDSEFVIYLATVGKR